MNKTKITIFGTVAAIVAAVSMIVVQAATPLTVTCAGSVTNNTITWTANSAGGNGPYALLWSGDTSVAGSTSTPLNVMYGTNGIYTAMIRSTDASSTVATSTCMATVTSNVVATPTSTLNVFVGVNNTAGGSATSSNFVITIGGGASASPATFNGSAAGTAVKVNASTTYGVSVSALTNYAVSAAGNCAGPLAAGTTASCTITETFVAPTSTPPTPTSTPPLPHVNPPALAIGPNGMFLARGMTVTSVSSGSFQGTIWGITYTVNWSGNAFSEFFFRGGKHATSTNPITQLAVGDEVGVAGIVSASSPFVVTAKTVRDYSIVVARPDKHGGESDNNSENDNKGGDHTGINASGSASVNFQSHIGDLLNKLKGLQDLFKKNGKGNKDN